LLSRLLDEDYEATAPFSLLCISLKAMAEAPITPTRFTSL